MLTVLGGLAEFERDLIRARTGEGRERAKARGQKMGRPPKLTAAPAARGDQAPRPGRGTLADIGRSYNVSGATISRLTTLRRRDSPDDLDAVFISYTHDSPEHLRAVFVLSERFRSEGINCVLDQYETSPPEGWPRWMD